MRLSTYLESISLVIKVNLQYKANLAFSALFPYVTAGMMFLFWDAALPQGAAATGYSTKALITYYLLAALLQNAVVPTVKYDVFYAIRSGTFDTWSVKPLSYPAKILLDGIGSSVFRLFYSTVAMVPLIALIIHAYGIDGIRLTAATAAAVFLAIILSSVISTLASMTAFWLENADGMAWLVYFAGLISSGQLIPLSFFPPSVRAACEASPFALLFSFPADLLLGKTAEAAPVILRQLFWIALLGLGFTTLLYSAGTKRYQSAGG